MDAVYSRQEIRRVVHPSILILVTVLVTACHSSPTTATTTATTTTTTTTTQDPPTVTQIDPTTGSADGGTSVTVTGTGFTNVSSVTIGSAAISSYSVSSDTSITVITTAASAGALDVVVTTPGGSSEVTEADAFDFIPNPLTDLSFSAASVTPGSPVHGNVSVTYPAPVNGIKIPLNWSASTTSAAVLYPLTVIIPSGATSASFQVTTFFTSSSQTLQVSAEHGGESRAASVIVGP